MSKTAGEQYSIDEILKNPGLQSTENIISALHGVAEEKDLAQRSEEIIRLTVKAQHFRRIWRAFSYAKWRTIICNTAIKGLDVLAKLPIVKSENVMKVLFDDLGLLLKKKNAHLIGMAAHNATCETLQTMEKR